MISLLTLPIDFGRRNKDLRYETLAITACTAGVAHTYMAAKNLENKAKARGWETKVEKQGANGIDDRIIAQDVASADGIIYATDVGLAEMERFEGLPSVKGKVKDGLRLRTKCLTH